MRRPSEPDLLGEMLVSSAGPPSRYLVGLEVHQQLATGSKLFCPCRVVEEPSYSHSFLRRLRPTQSELGQIDPAAMFEFRRGVMIRYRAGESFSCLVEEDEEPPHSLNPEALESALLVALTLGSRPVDEIHVMRKIVIDGSNTTGFQRTMIVANGGELAAGGRKVAVQRVSLEEDAARLIGEQDGTKEYGLERLGIPLVEVALAPVEASPQEVREIALALGRLLRSTGRAARGLGTIRQDLNISVEGGAVIEVKGIQKLELLPKIVEYEVKRQTGLLYLAGMAAAKGVPNHFGVPVDVTDLFEDSSSQVIRKALETDGVVLASKLEKFRGLLGLDVNDACRLGRELAELVRFYGLGGLFHGDELPAYGITSADIDGLVERLDLGSEDSFILLGGPRDRVEEALESLHERLAFVIRGPPPETRGPTGDGRARFIRPRPGASRMYPETDIPPAPVTEELLETISAEIPEPWEQQVMGLQRTYHISRNQSLQLYDSSYLSLFEDVVRITGLQPSIVATTLTETLVSVSRQGLETDRLSQSLLRELFLGLDSGRISKEAIPGLLETILKEGLENVEAAVQKLGISAISPDDLQRIIDGVLGENETVIREKGERARGQLMGRVMNRVRGRVDGKVVSSLLEESLKKKLQETGQKPI